jgi:hypothetical protein
LVVLAPVVHYVVKEVMWRPLSFRQFLSISH